MGRTFEKVLPTPISKLFLPIEQPSLRLGLPIGVKEKGLFGMLAENRKEKGSADMLLAFPLS